MTLNELFDQRRESIKQRFAARYAIVVSGCWIWTGGWDRGQYGCFYIGNHKVAAHRVSYALHRGGVPEGMMVCHRCDTPPCVNPEHLFLGTAGDNNADRSIKRRSSQPFGEVEKRRKLTVADVHLIKTDTRSARALARLLGVRPNTVAKIRRGETWKHVSAPPVAA